MTRPPASKGSGRRRFLAAAGATGLVAASSIAAPAIAQNRREVRVVTTWPPDFPGFGTSAERLAKRIAVMSGGSLAVKVFPAGALVPAFDSFDAVSRGDAEMYHAIEHYWQGKSNAFGFFAAVPFGLTPGEMNAWIYQGGGQALWDELSAGFNLKPFLAGNTGVHMAGWYNRRITSVDDFTGLRVAISGLGGKVLRRLGASAVALPGNELVSALRAGKIDAAEWFGPWHGLAMGFQNAATEFYYPGVYEPGTALTCAVNLKFWDSLTYAQQQVIEAATAAENTFTLAEFNARNAEALGLLREEYGIQPRELPNNVLGAIGDAAAEVVADAGKGDPLAAKIYTAFVDVRRKAIAWSKLSEYAYLHARLLPFKYTP